MPSSVTSSENSFQKQVVEDIHSALGKESDGEISTSECAEFLRLTRNDLSSKEANVAARQIVSALDSNDSRRIESIELPDSKAKLDDLVNSIIDGIKGKISARSNSQSDSGANDFQRQTISDIHDVIGKSNDGRVSVRECARFLRKTEDLSKSESREVARNIADAIDKNGNGIEASELPDNPEDLKAAIKSFVDAVKGNSDCEEGNDFQRQTISDIHDVIGKSNDGRVSVRECARFLRKTEDLSKSESREVARNIADAIDKNGNGIEASELPDNPEDLKAAIKSFVDAVKGNSDCDKNSAAADREEILSKEGRIVDIGEPSGASGEAKGRSGLEVNEDGSSCLTVVIRRLEPQQPIAMHAHLPGSGDNVLGGHTSAQLDREFAAGLGDSPKANDNGTVRVSINLSPAATEEFLATGGQIGIHTDRKADGSGFLAPTLASKVNVS